MFLDQSFQRYPTLTEIRRIDVSTRLRRAIHLNDLVLVKRIIKNNPTSLRNHDFGDNGNTSLHLAAKLGLLEVAVRFPPHPPTSPIPLILTPTQPDR